ncbi:GGDEF domain-containing protein [Kineosporia succinea]|nr:GGDEF domain-containing protein [Kineosporia succinea]
MDQARRSGTTVPALPSRRHPIRPGEAIPGAPNPGAPNPGAPNPGEPAQPDLRAELAELAELNDLVSSEPTQARTRAAELEQRAHTLGARDIVAGALLVRAESHQRTGELTTAVALISRATDLAAPLTGEHLVRACLLTGFVYNDLGDEATSLQHVMDAIGAFTDDVPPRLRARVLNKAADLVSDLGSWSDAMLWYSRAEEVARGDARLHLMVANNRAYNALLNGKTDDALASVKILHDLSARYGHPLDAASLDTVARIHLMAGDLPRAAEVALQAVAVLGTMPFKSADVRPYYLLTVAVTQRAQGHLRRAADTLAQARRACIEEGYTRVKNEILREQAELSAALGDHRAAFELLSAYVEADQQLRSSQREAQAQIRQALYETQTAREEAARYREEARRDPLTGLRNRLYVTERLSELLHDDDTEITLALLDLDHFKSVNDRFSHEAGDRVLQQIARMLEAAAPDDGSFAARFGGEELLLVLLTHQAAPLVEELRLAVEQHDWNDITPGRGITLSAGLTTRRPGDTADDLLARADRQLYIAKSRGRNRISA